MKSKTKITMVSDAKGIFELAGRHIADPDRFISSLDSFFRNMCMEMVNAKGGKL
jgi:hypothetical protein